MKRLTINQIAAAGLRKGKRAYLSLATGIFLSIFLITVICLCVRGVLVASDEREAQKIGYEDFLLLDEPTYADTDLMATGLFGRIGHVYLEAAVTDSTLYLGWYDEEGASLLNRRMAEGRMPEKAGEIAVERSALESLRIEAEVGDAITLPVTPIDGFSEERTFTLTGILKEQTTYFGMNSSSSSSEDNLRAFPTFLIHPDDANFSSGRTVVHRLMTVGEGANFYRIMDEWTGKMIEFYGVYQGDLYHWTPSILYTSDDMFLILAVAVILGLAFLVACGVGIGQSMEGMLVRQREEIGMLRAVGATRRQIRKIFGRETWLLALILSPLSVAAGCGAAYLISRISPEMLAFAPEWFILVPVVIFSMLCILLSARLPLRRASRIMPMSVMRDVELLRKIRRVRSQKTFSAPRLISTRQLRLHPTRQMGAAFLVMMMLVCMILSIDFFGPQMASMSAIDEAFYIRDGFYWTAAKFATIMPRSKLTVQDIRQIESLDSVSEVSYYRDQDINLLLDEEDLASEYLQSFIEYGWERDHLLPGQDDDEYKLFRDMMELEQAVYPFSLRIVDDHTLDAMKDYVADGQIDTAAIDAGREVIVYAPDFYTRHYEDKYGSGSSSQYGEWDDRYGEWTSKSVNDYFHVGRQLDFMQNYLYTDENIGLSQQDDAFAQKVYSAAHRIDVSTKVGALLVGNASVKGVGGPGIITSEQGAQAMGIYTGDPYVNIYVEGEIDQETEEYLEERLENIAMRGEDAHVSNNLASHREYVQTGSSLILLFASVSLVFFAVAVSVISGNVKRRISADTRMIGTIRAVGADRKAVAGCYVGQIMMSIVLGAAAIALAYGLALMCIEDMRNYIAQLILPTFLMIPVLSLACYGCCYASLRMSLREVMSKSIIENIREL